MKTQTEIKELDYKGLYNLVQKRAESYANKNDYYCTDEYKELYPLLCKLYKSEGHEQRRNEIINTKKRLTQMINQGTIETGFPVGLFI